MPSTSGIGSISAVARHCRDTKKKLRVLFGLPGIKLGFASCPDLREFDTSYARRM